MFDIRYSCVFSGILGTTRLKMDTRHTLLLLLRMGFPRFPIRQTCLLLCLNSQQNEIKCKEEENTILPEYVGRFLQHALYQTFELHICALMSVNSSIVCLNCDRRFCNYNFQMYRLHSEKCKAYTKLKKCIFLPTMFNCTK